MESDTTEKKNNKKIKKYLEIHFPKKSNQSKKIKSVIWEYWIKPWHSL